MRVIFNPVNFSESRNYNKIKKAGANDVAGQSHVSLPVQKMTLSQLQNFANVSFGGNVELTDDEIMEKIQWYSEVDPQTGQTKLQNMVERADSAAVGMPIYGGACYVNLSSLFRGPVLQKPSPYTDELLLHQDINGNNVFHIASRDICSIGLGSFLKLGAIKDSPETLYHLLTDANKKGKKSAAECLKFNNLPEEIINILSKNPECLDKFLSEYGHMIEHIDTFLLSNYDETNADVIMNHTIPQRASYEAIVGFMNNEFVAKQISDNPQGAVAKFITGKEKYGSNILYGLDRGRYNFNEFLESKVIQQNPQLLAKLASAKDAKGATPLESLEQDSIQQILYFLKESPKDLEMVLEANKEFVPKIDPITIFGCFGTDKSIDNILMSSVDKYGHNALQSLFLEHSSAQAAIDKLAEFEPSYELTRFLEHTDNFGNNAFHYAAFSYSAYYMTKILSLDVLKKQPDTIIKLLNTRNSEQGVTPIEVFNDEENCYGNVHRILESIKDDDRVLLNVINGNYKLDEDKVRPYIISALQKNPEAKDIVFNSQDENGQTIFSKSSASLQSVILELTNQSVMQKRVDALEGKVAALEEKLGTV